MDESAARSVYSRFSIAVALSAGLHLSLIYGVAPRPGARARPMAPLAARLVSEPVASTLSDAGKRVAPAPPQRVASPLPLPVSVLAMPPDAPLVAVPASNGAESLDRREDSALPKADLPFPVDLQWYEARDLDTYPRALSPLDLSQSTSERTDGPHGTVTLLLAIDEAGGVHDAAVVSEEPAGSFEPAALAAVRAARFAPARKDGQDVRSKIIVKLRFPLQQQAER